MGLETHVMIIGRLSWETHRIWTQNCNRSEIHLSKPPPAGMPMAGTSISLWVTGTAPDSAWWQCNSTDTYSPVLIIPASVHVLNIEMQGLIQKGVQFDSEKWHWWRHYSLSASSLADCELFQFFCNKTFEFAVQTSLEPYCVYVYTYLLSQLRKMFILLIKGQMHHHDDSIGSKCAYTCHLLNKTTRKSVLLSTPEE